MTPPNNKTLNKNRFYHVGIGVIDGELGLWVDGVKTDPKNIIDLSIEYQVNPVKRITHLENIWHDEVVAPTKRTHYETR